VQAIIRPDNLDELVDTLTSEGLLQGMTVTEVKGFGRQRGAKVEGVAADKVKFLPKVRVELVVNEWDVPHVMEVMQKVLNTGKFGDGKVFVFEAEEVLRIRTGEVGVSAV
jgi:nitrogen regulatory protein PII